MTIDPIHPAIGADRVAVITGGASGIGLAVAQRLAAFGMKVCLLDNDSGLLAAAAARTGAACSAFNVDVSNAAAMTALATEVSHRFGPVSVLMNNAGIGGGGDALSNPDGWRQVIGVNLFGVLNGVQAFVPAMLKSNLPGLVINTGSKQGITQPPGDTAYNVSKAAVKALTEGLAHTLREMSGSRITAHLLIPGFTYTGMMARYLPERPAAAWLPDQVADRMLAGLAANEFYILCEDNETTRRQDEKRIAWAAGDLIENRPALSRWHPDWKIAFAEYMAS